MKKIRALIIEDEPQAREMLQTLLTDYCDDVHVIGEAPNLKEGVALIKKLIPDLVFLDIEMPGEKGINLFNYFEKIDFEVIFTTAYDQYAINALRLSALDYLLKPIDLKDLRFSLVQFREQQQQQHINQALRYQFAIQPTLPKRIVLPSKESFTFLEIDDIMYCKAENNYTLFIAKDNKKHLVSKSIKEYTDLLESFNFIRVHRSAIINLKYVGKLIRTRPISIIMKDGTEIPVSKTKQDYLIEQLTKA